MKVPVRILKVILIFLPGIWMIYCSSDNHNAGKNAECVKARWSMTDRGEIRWNIEKDSLLPHLDNIEMSGRKVSAIITYGVDSDKQFKVKREVIWPALRINLKKGDPDWMRYRAYLRRTYTDTRLPLFAINGKPLPLEKSSSVILNGTLIINHPQFENISLTRTIFPSPAQPMLVEYWTFENHGQTAACISMKLPAAKETENGFYGQYIIDVTADSLTNRQLEPGKKLSLGIYFSARKAADQLTFNASAELAKRNEFISEMKGSLQLCTPDSLLNSAFLFAKIRTSESLFDTRMGLVHSPGGGRYYGGVWANDQVEYAGPFFPFLGYKPAIEASLNAYRIFANDMKDENKPIWSSHEMEGDLTCCGKDRGDAAMYLFGASRFLLALGDKSIAGEMMPSIRWAIEYNEHKLNKEGVVASQTDEMEGRIPTGDANLSTSVLFYGGLLSAAYLSNALREPKTIQGLYRGRAWSLKDSIEKYFGANIEGYKTYRYFKGHTKLRHWICLPLTMDINERKEETLKALFGKLWTNNGLLVESGLNMFWDRGTLYALRGALNAGATDTALAKLYEYSCQRLLGEHVPYAVEAWPEGNQAHLAAESALYCRIFTEGLFGIKPTGFRSFTCAPRLPTGWDKMELINIKAFEQNFNLLVERKRGNIQVTVTSGGKIIYSMALPKEHVHRISFEPAPPQKQVMDMEL